MISTFIALVVTISSWPQEQSTLDPALKTLSKFIGGKWSGSGQMPIEQEWVWNPDKKGISIITNIGKGTPKSRIARAFLGWDPVAKKPYYLDMHGSDMTYYGFLSEKNGVVEFRFGQLGSGKTDWVERGKFLGENEWESSLYQIKEGKEEFVHSFKLVRKKE